jgi:DNA invertase Pin-like site-specific DNA recombinase
MAKGCCTINNAWLASGPVLATRGGLAMFIGYARVSTTDQTLALQEDALRAAGCREIFRDVMSGAAADRPGLHAALAYARAGDVLVVWRLDRLGRSLKHLIAVVEELRARDIGFKSLQEAMDTTTPGGQLIFHLFGALAEFKRALIRERTQAGLAAARARGRRGDGEPGVKTLWRGYRRLEDLTVMWEIVHPPG